MWVRFDFRLTLSLINPCTKIGNMIWIISSPTIVLVSTNLDLNDYITYTVYHIEYCTLFVILFYKRRRSSYFSLSDCGITRCWWASQAHVPGTSVVIVLFTWKKMGTLSCNSANVFPRSFASLPFLYGHINIETTLRQHQAT